MDKVIKIMLADDHRLVRDGIKALLMGFEEFSIVGDVDSGDKVLPMIEQTLPDIVLLDINMPGMNGIEVLQQVKNINPNIRFIILSMHEESAYILKAVKAGASGYLLKNSELDELHEAIRKVATGGKYFNEKITRIIIENISASADELPAQDGLLTQREHEILLQISKGLSSKMIAEKFNISVRTVETHRVNIMKKLDTHNTAELVRKAVDKKLI